MHLILTWRKANTVNIRSLLKEQFFEPVLVIIPTLGEPLNVVENVIKSVLFQSYKNKIIMLSDDGYDELKKELVNRLLKEFPKDRIIYFNPPKRESTERKGDAKAGNLNAALQFAKENCDFKYVETRDSDDLITSPKFYEKTIAYLNVKNKDFVQTIKNSYRDKNDRFGNNEEYFYKFILAQRETVNAVFPCGSGLIWKKESLLKIGGFPAWNLVEDFQSGLEAQKLGLKTGYLPIIGASSISPVADMPNFIKQRGVWAIDAFRILFFFPKKGLTKMQILAANEPSMYYILSIVNLFFSIIAPIILITSLRSFNFRKDYEIGIYTAINVIIIFYPILNSIKNDVSLKSLFRSIENFYGLAPVYLNSLFLTFLYGENKKPVYKVTRKYSIKGIYFHLVIPQILLTFFIYTCVFIALKTKSTSLDLVSLFWSLYYGFFYISFVIKSISI